MSVNEEIRWNTLFKKFNGLEKELLKIMKKTPPSNDYTAKRVCKSGDNLKHKMLIPINKEQKKKRKMGRNQETNCNEKTIHKTDTTSLESSEMINKKQHRDWLNFMEQNMKDELEKLQKEDKHIENVVVTQINAFSKFMKEILSRLTSIYCSLITADTKNCQFNGGTLKENEAVQHTKELLHKLKDTCDDMKNLFTTITEKTINNDIVAAFIKGIEETKIKETNESVQYILNQIISTYENITEKHVNTIDSGIQKKINVVTNDINTITFPIQEVLEKLKVAYENVKKTYNNTIQTLKNNETDIKMCESDLKENEKTLFNVEKPIRPSKIPIYSPKNKLKSIDHLKNQISTVSNVKKTKNQKEKIEKQSEQKLDNEKWLKCYNEKVNRELIDNVKSRENKRRISVQDVLKQLKNTYDKMKLEYRTISRHLIEKNIEDEIIERGIFIRGLERAKKENEICEKNINKSVVGEKIGIDLLDGNGYENVENIHNLSTKSSKSKILKCLESLRFLSPNKKNYYIKGNHTHFSNKNIFAQFVVNHMGNEKSDESIQLKIEDLYENNNLIDENKMNIQEEMNNLETDRKKIEQEMSDIEAKLSTFKVYNGDILLQLIDGNIANEYISNDTNTNIKTLNTKQTVSKHYAKQSKMNPSNKLGTVMSKRNCQRQYMKEEQIQTVDDKESQIELDDCVSRPLTRIMKDETNQTEQEIEDNGIIRKAEEQLDRIDSLLNRSVINKNRSIVEVAEEQIQRIERYLSKYSNRFEKEEECEEIDFELENHKFDNIRQYKSTSEDTFMKYPEPLSQICNRNVEGQGSGDKPIDFKKKLKVVKLPNQSLYDWQSPDDKEQIKYTIMRAEHGIEQKTKNLLENLDTNDSGEYIGFPNVLNEPSNFNRIVNKLKTYSVTEGKNSELKLVLRTEKETFEELKQVLLEKIDRLDNINSILKRIVENRQINSEECEKEDQ
ncbi:centrosomal protein of 63 kDa-like [Diorhabda carinulata]|uniref:centrosomal protein of 63 kDa-like n=1 Tax=Diorhabda carinulata TaxID=1163345 RepID=UPI0025A2DF1E|nr:centrosomal protein of 63 kDa-like [Diorhabda carinulata]